jgi:hypothetical protein
MSRCICVLGTGRSGTSATAGMLHKLGVPMGEPFVGADGNNPWGTFEDARLMALTRRVVAGREPVEAFRPVFAALAEQPLWGFKIPAFVEIASEALPLLQLVCDEVRLVTATRPREACIASYQRAYGAEYHQARRWYDERYSALMRVLAAWDGPVLDVWWAVTRVDPMLQACRLARFAFGAGDGFPPREVVQEAAGHIRQEVGSRE